LVQKKKGEEIVLFAGGHRFDIIDAATPPSTPQTVDGAKLISCAYFGDQSFNFLRHKISPAKKMRNKAFRKTRAHLSNKLPHRPRPYSSVPHCPAGNSLVIYALRFLRCELQPPEFEFSDFWTGVGNGFFPGVSGCFRIFRMTLKIEPKIRLVRRRNLSPAEL